MGNLTAVTDYLGRGIRYTYDLMGNLTSVTDAQGRTERMTYDIAGRLTSYTSNGGNTVTYDYDKLDSLVEKAYTDAQGEESGAPVAYAYDALGERVALHDSTGDTRYTYDSLGRITSVTAYRTPGEEEGSFSHEKAQGDTVTYTYDGADNLAAITYPDGTKVSYKYDLNDNLIKVTDREGLVTAYVYDAINRVTEIHRPNGISTYNTYNEADQITELSNICDDCGWVVSRYAYTYDARGFIVEEKAVESLAGYAYDDKHDGKHEDGRHDDLYPHGNKHSKHDKDATFAYQIIETDRTFTYDDAGKLLSATETEDNYGTCVYSYAYDGMGNRTAVIKTNEAGEVVESRKYVYNESNQLVSVELFDGKKTTSVSYTYDADGNLISEIGKDGTDKVELTYLYTVENRLEAVYDKKELLMAAAYDGDGNRVFMLNYNLHTDEDWKGNSGNGNGSNKDNAGSGNSGNDNNSGSNGNSSENNGNGNGNSSSNNGNGNSSGNNGNGNSKNTNNGNSGNSSANNGKGGNGKNNGNVGNKGNSGNGNSAGGINGNGNNGNGNSNSGNGNSSGNSTGNGNATNAETNNSQNQSGILFPIASETSDTESYLIGLIKTSGKEKNYELIEYINDVNREYAEVLVEQNINGALDTAYVYGAAIGTGSDRLSLDRFDGNTGYYLYDPRGSVTGLTNEEGQIYQSYRYSVFGEITFGAPQYENEYTYNGESYNPNIKSQYLRARYYCVVTADFLTEDSYLGRITEPLTLNRYNYCLGNPMNYVDPSGQDGEIYYLNNVDGAKGLGHNAILIVNNEGEGTFFTYMTGEGTPLEVYKGKSIIGYMDEVTLSMDEVTEFLLNGDILVHMAGGEENEDSYDRALKRTISDEKVIETIETARKFVTIYEQYLEIDDKESYRQNVPLYNLYTFNCDTVASVIAHSVDENFKVFRYDGLDWLWGLMGLSIASPNLSFLYSKGLNLEGWEYISIGEESKKEKYINRMWNIVKFFRIKPEC